MEHSYLVQGFLIGFSVATSIGVSGVLCLQNMMTGRVSVALASAVAAASADMTCANIVVFGLSAIQIFLMQYRFMFSIMTAIFLCGLGIYKIVSSLKLHSMHKESQGVLHAFFSIFFLAIVDPVTVMDFAALSLGFSFDFSLFRHEIYFLIGLFFGSLSWWLSLCIILLYFHQSISLTVFQRIQQIVGVGLIILSGYILLKNFLV